MDTIHDALFPGHTQTEVRHAARACLRAAQAIAARGGEPSEWDAPEAEEARRLTGELGWSWDFEDWHHAASVLDTEADRYDS